MTRRKDPRIDVMLSSTSRDLPEHRAQATNAIMRVGMHPIVMETLAASIRDAIEESLRLVDEAEVYVGIFGHRYGYIPDDPRNPDRISITEMEYRHAMKTGKVMLIFIMSDEHPGPRTVREGASFYEPTEEGRQKLEALKAELFKTYTVSLFTSPDDLHAKVLHALHDPELLARVKGTAGEGKDDKEARTKLPTPPEFYADPPYTLTTEFVGRRDELRRLDTWADSSDPLMLVEAIGGMGKSAVTWQWVQEHALKTRHYDGVMWWSFYESGATMAAFVRHALAYITEQDPDTLKSNGIKENFRQLRLELTKGRYLLVLDGLERVLVAYHRWNAAQMRDDKVDDAESIIKDRQIRECTDPVDDEILKGLLSCERTKILISTRLIPLALEDRTDNLSKSVAHIHLNGLHPDDALTLIQHSGVRVRDKRQFETFIQTFGRHSLLVKLIAGRINRFRRARRDFDRWYAEEGRDLKISDIDLKQNQNHILKYALEDLNPEAMRFLSQIAAFDDAVKYDVLTLFNPYVQPAPEQMEKPDLWLEEGIRDWADTIERRQYWQQRIEETNAPYQSYLKTKADYDRYLKSSQYREALTQFDEMLNDLEERGLLQWERDKDIYDMHPVVRSTVFDRLEGDTRVLTFERIRGYFERQTDDIENAKEVTDLSNTIAIYRALVGAGKWDEAADFFAKRLQNKLTENISAYYTVIELLTPLFVDGIDTLPHLNDASLQSRTTTTMGNMFFIIGRNDEALTLSGLTLKLYLNLDDSANLSVGLRNYANWLRNDNQLALAEKIYQAALVLAVATKEQEEITLSILSLLGSYKDMGQWNEVERAYQFLIDNPSSEIYWQAVVEQWYAETLLYRGLNATTALDKAESLAVKSNNALSYRQIKGWRGEAALKAENDDDAIRLFEESIQLERKAGSVDVYIQLGGLARAYTHKGDHERAREIVDNSHVPYTDAAEVYCLMVEHDKAREYAIKAYRAAWADGPPYMVSWHLDRAKAVLDALGEPYPEMPPYDPLKIGKYLYQDEIEAYIEQKRRENEGKAD